VVGTLEFMAPEVLMGGAGAAPARPADVYAWAVTVACTAAGVSVPYADATRDNPAAHTVLDFGYGRAELAAAVVGAGLRPTLAPGCPPALASLLDEAWDGAAGARPTAAEVEMRMRALCEAVFGMDGAAAAGGSGGDEEEEEEEGWVRDGGADGMDGGTGAAAAPPPPPPPPVALPTTADAAAPSLPPWTDPPWWPPPVEAAAFGDTTYELVCGEGGDAANAAAAAAAASAPAAPPPPLAAGFHAQRGGRDAMEDAVAVASPLPTAPGAGPGHLLAVFDGHRGAGAAAFAAGGVVEAVRSAWCGGQGCSTAAHPAQALAAAFAALHAGWVAVEARAAAAAAAAGRPPPSPCGSTATVALVWRDWLFVACAGDARAVLVTSSGRVLRLSADHTPGDAGERARCRGGLALHGAGGLRLGPPALAVTRSLGDADAIPSGLTHAPTVTARRLGGGAGRDACLVVASDGLYDVLSDAEVGALVRDTVKDAALAAKRLVMEALGRGSGDNVSAVVAFLRAETTCELVVRDKVK
jgi:serine/threonine protein phosphatase PrpC